MPATLTRRVRRTAAGAVCAMGFALFLQSPGAAEAQSTPFTPLTLQNAWTDTQSGTAHAAVRIVNGIIYFKGAIANGTNEFPFSLPKAFVPPAIVRVPADMCTAHTGRLDIYAIGPVGVTAEGDFADARCFTSLDGVSFARSGSLFTTLKLQNGWTQASGSAAPGVRLIDGIVHFRGAISIGSSTALFTLPKAFRPDKAVYVPVDLCQAHNGRLVIQPSGQVHVQVGRLFSDAQCFTSLDGASFAKSGTSFTSLTLKNGWTNTKYGTAHAAARAISGIVHLRGAIATTGSNPVPFILPKALRPANSVYVPVDLCGARNGRLVIRPTGVVGVSAERSFSDAQCFTSLDGVVFAR